MEESGRPRVEVALDADGETIERLEVRQSDPADAGRTWNQQLDLRLGYGGDASETLAVHLRDATAIVAAAAGRPAPDYVLANGAGLGYGLMALDARTRDYLLAELPGIEDALTRAIGWVSLWDALLEGEVAPEALIDLAQRALPAETDEQNVSRILGYLTAAYWRHLTPARRAELAPDIETLLWRGAAAAGSRSLVAAWFGAYRNVALSADAVARLERIWREEEEVPGVPLAERDFTALAQGLAVRGAAGSAEILVEQRDRIDNPDRRAAFEFVMPALSAERAVRDAFVDALRDPANRAREPWVLTALRLLHHPLRARESEVYLRPGLDLLEEIQRTGDIFFPLSWLQTTLDGHQTATAAAIVEQYLADRPDLAPRLRAKALQAADGLQRAARIVRRPGVCAVERCRFPVRPGWRQRSRRGRWSGWRRAVECSRPRRSHRLPAGRVRRPNLALAGIGRKHFRRPVCSTTSEPPMSAGRHRQFSTASCALPARLFPAPQADQPERGHGGRAALDELQQGVRGVQNAERADRRRRGIARDEVDAPADGENLRRDADRQDDHHGQHRGERQRRRAPAGAGIPHTSQSTAPPMPICATFQSWKNSRLSSDDR